MTSAKSAVARALLCPMLCLTLGKASAADLPVPAPATPSAPLSAQPFFPFLPDNLLVTVGGGVEATSTFPGSKSYSAFPIPYVDWREPGTPEPFHTPDDGFGVILFNTSMIKAGPVARYVPERNFNNGNSNSSGLPVVGLTLELGGFIEFWPTEFLRTRTEIREAVNGHDGLDANLEADAIYRTGPVTLSLGPRAAFGNTQFMQAYFSVTPAEAAANGKITPFAASGGLTSVGFLGAAKYDFSDAFNLTGFAGTNRLVGSAGASPITNVLGSKNEFIGGVMFEYTFTLGRF